MAGIRNKKAAKRVERSLVKGMACSMLVATLAASALANGDKDYPRLAAATATVVTPTTVPAEQGGNSNPSASYNQGAAQSCGNQQEADEHEAPRQSGPVIVKQHCVAECGDDHPQTSDCECGDSFQWTDIILAILTALLAWMAVLQTTDVRRQTDNAELVDRPWFTLRVRRPPAYPFIRDILDVIQDPNPPPNEIVAAEGILTNTGHLPGWMTKSYTAMRYVDHPVELQPPRTEDEVRRLMAPCPELAVPVGDHHGFIPATVLQLTPAQRQAIGAGRASIVLLAFFEYRGPRKRRGIFRPTTKPDLYETCLCWEWKWEAGPNGVLMPGTGPGGPQHWTRFT